MQVASTTMALDLIVRCNLPIVACVRDCLGVATSHDFSREYSAEPPWISTFDLLEGKFFNSVCMFIGYTETHIFECKIFVICKVLCVLVQTLITRVKRLLLLYT